jgi:hypothetical protein
VESDGIQDANNCDASEFVVITDSVFNNSNNALMIV